MIEVIYTDGDLALDSTNEVRIRKGADGDVSGDFNSYADETTISTQDYSITAKGHDGAVYLATWESGGHGYSISTSKGMTEAEITALVTAVS